MRERSFECGAWHERKTGPRGCYGSPLGQALIDFFLLFSDQRSQSKSIFGPVGNAEEEEWLGEYWTLCLALYTMRRGGWEERQRHLAFCGLSRVDRSACWTLCHHVQGTFANLTRDDSARRCQVLHGGTL